MSVGLDSGQYGSQGHLTLGNVPLDIPVLRQSGSPSLRAPEWMVEIPDITKSNVAGFETYAELFDWHAEYSRHTLGHTANEMFTTAAIEHTEVSLLIPAGTFTAKVRQKLNNGGVNATITIVRLGNLTDLKKPLQKITYTNCIFTRVGQKFDYFGVAFRFTKVKEENFEMGQMDEAAAGNNVCEVDYATSVIT